MKKFTLILILTGIAFTTAIAQKSLSGNIVSKNDGQPIELATIRLFTYQGADSTLVQGTQTYYDGEFLLRNNVTQGYISCAAA